jgi:hypothetical protein
MVSKLKQLLEQTESQSVSDRNLALANIADLFRFPVTPIKKANGTIDYEYYNTIIGKKKFQGLTKKEELLIVNKLADVSQTTKKLSGMFYCIGLTNHPESVKAMEKIINNNSIVFDEEDLYQIAIAIENMFLKIQEMAVKGVDSNLNIFPIFDQLDRLAKGASRRIKTHINHIRMLIKKIRD